MGLPYLAQHILVRFHELLQKWRVLIYNLYLLLEQYQYLQLQLQLNLAMLQK